MSAESPTLFPVYPQLPLEVVTGEGVVLKTADGRELIDFYGGHAVAGLGYRHPAILRCLEETATRLFFQTTAIPSPERAAAGDALVDFAPDGLDRAFFVSSGRRGERERPPAGFPQPARAGHGGGARRRLPRPHRGGLGGDRRFREVVRLSGGPVPGAHGSAGRTPRRSPPPWTPGSRR